MKSKEVERSAAIEKKIVAKDPIALLSVSTSLLGKRMRVEECAETKERKRIEMCNSEYIVIEYGMAGETSCLLHTNNSPGTKLFFVFLFFIRRKLHNRLASRTHSADLDNVFSCYSFSWVFLGTKRRSARL